MSSQCSELVAQCEGPRVALVRSLREPLRISSDPNKINGAPGQAMYEVELGLGVQVNLLMLALSSPCLLRSNAYDVGHIRAKAGEFDTDVLVKLRDLVHFGMADIGENRRTVFALRYFFFLGCCVLSNMHR